LQEQKIFFLVSNREGKVIRGNRETMQLLRYSEEESATLQIGDLLENGFRVWKYLLDKLDSGKELFYEYLLFQDADGERSALNVRIYRITVPGSEQLIAIEGELPGRDPIPESNALQVLEIFADRIANEVLNPLNIIQGRIQLLSLTPAADEKIVHACSVLERNANRIQQSMEQLLRFARLRVDTVPQKIEISKILQMAADEWARRSDKNYPVKVKTPPKTAVHITGAETHLDALILGVLDFIQREVPGDEPVEMSGDATKAEIRIIIETGRTASPAHLEKLLTVPFYDPQEGDVRAGIGETIIQVVLQRYNAALKVEAADGDGIRINLCFPTE
jgi:signal transduction histidine kinase